uniref:hypothetical protein n=1 Tax=Alistipes ihumii TaxID=1470347 RepID=UPI003FF03518
GRPRSRPDRAAGPPEPGPFPQYLDQGTVRQDAEARIPAGHSGDSRFGISVMPIPAWQRFRRIIPRTVVLPSFRPDRETPEIPKP